MTAGSDANWVTGEVAVSVRGFTARQPIALVTAELERFRDELHELDANLTGEAELVHLEEEVGVTVRLKDGRGTLSGFLIEHTGPELRFGEIEVDQSFVRETLREFDALVTAFPVRGKPYA